MVLNKHISLVERVLIEKLSCGDKAAFSSIFSAYYYDMVMFASGFTHNPEIAEEFVQETFVKLWEDHKNINITDSLKSYLLKSVQNRCIDWYRHKKVQQIHASEVINTAILFEYNTDNYILRSELEALLKKALLTIPADAAEAFRMNREEGYKYQEIAKKLNVSVRTIEVRIGKALHLLRDYLKDYMQ